MSTHELHDHDLGLTHDLMLIEKLRQSRRRALGLMFSGGAAALLGACGGGSGGTTASTTTGGTDSGTDTSGSSCVANATETAGPYPSDGSNSVNGSISNILTASGVVRSDIRSSFGSSTNTAAGAPLTLTLNLVNANNNCVVLPTAVVYLWHCTRDGQYSLYSTAIQNENYLRGVQISDGNGQVTFQTIFPGCYSGRYPHIHFEVYPSLALATAYTNKILTSQIALPNAVCTEVYSGASGYESSLTNLSRVAIASDGVFGDNTAAQIAAMTPTISGNINAGYTGTMTIAVAA
jgi:protocatechuate 3,4-dioxygenase beta subunit